MRIVLLMAAYARGGAGRGPDGRASGASATRSVEAYLDRVERLAAHVAGDPLVTVGYAPHSLRAVPREWLVAIAEHAAGTGYPLHIHAGEQPREVEESLEEFGLRPIEHLYDCGVLGDRDDGRARHARLAATSSTCSRAASRPCAPARRPRPISATASCRPRELWERGVRVSFGADSNVRLDPFEEARETEGCARRQSGRRNVLVAEGDAARRPRSGAA